MFRAATIIFTLLVLAGCQTTQNRMAEYVPGKSVKTVFEFGAVQVPLPAGEWTVAGAEEYYNNQRSPIGRAVLLQIDGQTVRMAAVISAPLGGGGYGYAMEPACERRDMLHVQRFENYGGGDQDCWWINHIEMYLSNSTLALAAFAQADQFVKARGLKMPLNAVSVAYRFASNLRFLNAQFYFNPEADGFAPPAHAEWRLSDWHRDRVSADPAKVAYVEKLKAWGVAWHEKVKLGFAGKLVARGS